MKNLVIDIGNSRVKLGYFENGHLVQKWVQEDFKSDHILHWATNHNVSNIILSTVRGDLPKEALNHFQEAFCFLQLTASTALPIENKYETPQTLGKERLAAVVGAWAIYPNQHCLVVDAGTCMTMEFINAKGQYLGGNISPGVQMRLRAMHDFTAQLPKVEAVPEGAHVKFILA